MNDGFQESSKESGVKNPLIVRNHCKHGPFTVKVYLADLWHEDLINF